MTLPFLRCSISQIADLPDLIAARTRLARSRLEQSVWDTWITLLLITLTTASEWVLRKRRDLP